MTLKHPCENADSGNKTKRETMEGNCPSKESKACATDSTDGACDRGQINKITQGKRDQKPQKANVIQKSRSDKEMSL